MAAPDGKASMKAAEQLGNLRTRVGWEIVDRAVRHLEERKGREKAVGQTRKTRADARRARLDAERSLRSAVSRADGLIEEGLTLLEKLVTVGPTLERASLIGSAYKRRALVNGAVGRRGQVDRDLELMAASYGEAQAVGEKAGDGDVFYPAANCLVADVALNAGRARWRGLDRKRVDIIQQPWKTSEPGFWSAIGAIELDQYQALAKRRLASARPKLEKAYADVHRRVRSPRMWASVYDTACLVLPNYASRATGREKATAQTLLAQLQGFAHPAAE